MIAAAQASPGRRPDFSDPANICFCAAKPDARLSTNSREALTPDQRTLGDCEGCGIPQRPEPIWQGAAGGFSMRKSRATIGY
jgi:hypothetical protein